MRNPIWLPNIKKWLSGTVVGASAALDVNVVSSVAPGASTVLKEYRHHDAATINIDGNGGNFIEIGTVPSAANIANTITQLKVANNTGKALAISVGANAAAAAAAVPLMVVVAGQIGEAVNSVALVAGNKIWVRAVGASNVTSGILVAQLMG